MSDLGTLEARWKYLSLENDDLRKVLERHKIEHQFIELEKLQKLL